MVIETYQCFTLSAWKLSIGRLDLRESFRTKATTAAYIMIDRKESQLINLYRERLLSLDKTLTSLTDIIINDESIQVLSATASMQKYRIDRILQVVTNILNDQKELVIVNVLENYNTMKKEKTQLQEQIKQLTENLLALQSEKRSMVAIMSSSQIEQSRNNGVVSKAEYDKLKEELQAEKQNRQMLAEKLKESRVITESSSHNGRIITKQNSNAKLSVLTDDSGSEVKEYLMAELKKYQNKANELEMFKGSAESQITNLKEQNSKLFIRLREAEETIVESQSRAMAVEKYKFDDLSKKLTATAERVEELEIQNEELILEMEAQKQQTDTLIRRIRYETNAERQQAQREKDEILQQQAQLLQSKEETIGRLTRELMEKNQEHRRMLQELSRARQTEQQLVYDLRTKTDLINKLQNEIEIKRRHINRISNAEKYNTDPEQRPVRRYDRMGSPNNYAQLRQNRSPGIRAQMASHNRSFGRVVSNNVAKSEIDGLFEQIYKLDDQLYRLKTSHKNTKMRMRSQTEQGLDTLRRNVNHIRRTAENQIRMLKEETDQMIKSLANKCSKIVAQERDKHNQKLDSLKRSLEEEKSHMQQKLRNENQDHYNLRISELQDEILIRDQAITRLKIQVEKYKDLARNPYPLPPPKSLDTQTLIKIEGALSNTSEIHPIFRQNLDSPTFNNIPVSSHAQKRNTQNSSAAGYPTQSTLNRGVQQPVQSHYVDQKVPSADISVKRTNVAPVYGNSGVMDPSQDYFVRQLQEETKKLNEKSRRLELESGFNELEDEIEAIIERRNKRNAKLLK